MVLRKFKLAVCCFIITALPLTLFAITDEWQMIPKESQLGFTATQNGAPVSGQFSEFSAKIFFNKDNLKESSIEVTVDINSLNTSYEDLKSTLLTKEWFNAGLFPKALFKASQWKKLNDENYQAMGLLTIRDKSVPVTLNFKIDNTVANKIIARGNAVVKRLDFGVGQGEWASTNEIKDDVQITFKVAALKKGESK